ncbi:helix-turn-helix domain containing protein [Phaeobacter gallaeciensis]|uniref:TetR/AcrR family transcriptional regulator n=1 Tax=Phaeobacter gallaeciensis TaxID=60890 RepID=UPI00238013D8|nr:helix-turn-helix domain-containing protein [Phaeobacter gallaeciensis]MDE4276789.1 helix-turn-helix domain containing protein [Phaeobacter gallaeciensis]MDE4302009.1 helix-turn-helix domain containing protein [Phaeobacter gallaeciensis]MDE5187213.1 helix-turn-helix domain containing protein [Phaeobacter gallaeciensis]
MTRTPTSRQPSKDDQAEATRQRLKIAAQRLFSDRGIDGVSVRDIVAAAGLRNGASLHYYFGSKDKLIRDLVIDGAIRSDSARCAALDALAARDRAPSVHDIVRMLVEVETQPQNAAEGDGASGQTGFGHMRFIVSLQTNHRRLMDEALRDHDNIGYRRCLDHMRARLPHIPTEVLNQRFIFMYITLITSLAARETAFEADPTGGKLWSSPLALPNLVSTMAAGIEADWPDNASS